MGTVMRQPSFEARRRASGIISQLMLLCTDEMLSGLGGAMNIVADFPEIWVLMVIRRNDDRRQPPISQNKIAQQLHTSRQNVGRWLKSLENRGAVERSGRGYVAADGFLADRLNARYFRRIVRAICAASRDLQKLYGE